MSLLMQALKKAENAKQKQSEQSEVPAPTAISQEVAAPSEMEPLTLQLQEFPTDAQEQSAPSTTPEDNGGTTSSLSYFSSAPTSPQPPPAQPTLAEQQAALEADSGLTPKSSSMSASSSTNPQPPSQDMPQDTPPKKEIPAGGGTHGKLKIGLDEKQSAAIEAKKKLAARNAAKSVFDAKQKSPKRRALILGLLSLIILCVFGAYAYINILGIGQSPYANVATVTPQVVQPVTAVTDMAPVATAENTSPSAPADSVSINTAATVPAASPIDAPTMPETATASSSTLTAAPMPTMVPLHADAATTVMQSTPATLPSAQPPLPIMSKQSDAIQIRHTAATQHLNPVLSSAYQNYMAGDLMSAYTQYKSVLRQEPNNRDALLGIATIAIRRGQNAEAGSFYNRLLELNPNDAEASAGIASLDYNDPSRAESRLKNSLAQNPNSSATLFALGNTYAAQSRWSEAQQFYFRAFGIASENADYAYNLAISLDRLDQSKLALEYYQRALQLTQKYGGDLDKKILMNRIDALQSMR